MVFTLLISRNAFFDENNNVRKEIFTLMDLIKDRDIQVGLVTRSAALYKKIIYESFPQSDKIKYARRGDWSRKIVENNKNIMLIGAVNEDIYIAANNKILLINPTWIDVEENIQKYGFKLKNFHQIIQCIDILGLETQLLYDFRVDEKTRLIAVSNANKYYAVKNEEEMIKKYMGTLKYGNDYYKYAVYFHYLTMIFGMEEFHDVDYWMAFPSSTGSNENNIYDIVKRTRYLLNNRRSGELFIRHTPAEKSTSMSRTKRLQEGCRRHLETIHLNPKYKGKLKGKKVCVIDDYTTNGASFESARNLLIHEEVREIILVAIGTFQKSYNKEDYKITGNVYEPGANFTLMGEKTIYGTENEKSSEIINKIYDIITS
jgi:predicted amidophosphoribosyltransferase